MLRRLVLIPLFLVLTAGQTPPPAHASDSIRVTAKAGAVRLTLVLPHSSYEQGALARVTLALTNVSRHTVYLCTACSSGYLNVEVLPDAGQVVFPPAVPDIVPVRGGPGPRPALSLRPGKTIKTLVYVIFRGGHIRGLAVLKGGWSVSTPLVTVALAPAQSPVITLSSGPVPQVTVRPAVPTGSPMFFTYAFQCLQTGVRAGTVSGEEGWQSTSATEFALTGLAGCGEILQLHVVAGWLGRPVAEYHYVQG